ncbi:MAG TPA: hypothetical protein VHG91_07320, partial [Longimicrobium sp.]|nr:hypothetical protein [Longimicrobium sp.]
GEVSAYEAALDYRLRGDRLALGDDDAADPAPARAEDAEEEGRRVGVEVNVDGEDEVWERERRGRADFILGTGQSYNRVEGLPITFGPIFETPGENPFRLRVAGIYRTENGPEMGPERWGFEARAEQFFGGERRFRVGGSLFHKIDPIEDWHLTEVENGLSTFFLHRDYRDHYQREGGSVYAVFSPPSSPLSGRVEWRREYNESKATGSPWSLFDNDEEWRPQPLVATGDLQSLILSGTFDTRSDRRDPASGWYVQGEVERALSADLVRQGATIVPRDPGPEPIALPLGPREFGAFTHGLVDVRRYNRISPTSRLNLRFLAGGALDGDALPPQRQHAMGGEGSLPGYALFSQDCGARGYSTTLNDTEFFPAYGCDQFVLGQVEYRGDLSFRLDLSDWGERDGEWEEEGGDLDERDLHADLGWVLFADIGRGWSLDGTLGDTPTRADVGAGILLGRLGVYLAAPVTSGGDGVNFFIRLSPRF